MRCFQTDVELIIKKSILFRKMEIFYLPPFIFQNQRQIENFRGIIERQAQRLSFKRHHGKHKEAAGTLR